MDKCNGVNEAVFLALGSIILSGFRNCDGGSGGFDYGKSGQEMCKGVNSLWLLSAVVFSWGCRRHGPGKHTAKVKNMNRKAVVEISV